MKKSRKTKVTLAVTIPELPEGWATHQAIGFLRAALDHTIGNMPKPQSELLRAITIRVASTVEETVYDASVGGKRGGRSRAQV